MSAKIGIMILIAGLMSAKANVIVNGSFEAGNTGFSTSYNYQPSHRELPEGDYGITDIAKNLHWAGSTDHVDHTSGNGLMMMVNGKTTPNTLVWAQTVGVSANEIMRFSMWGSNWIAESYHFPLATLGVFINGDQIGSSYTTPAEQAVWSFFETEWNSEASTHADIEVRLLNSGSSGYDFALDDLSFEAIPEPASAVFIVISAIGGIWIRKFFVR